MTEDETMDLLAETTRELRHAAIARHVGSLPARLQEVLDEVLTIFVTTHPFGATAAHAHLPPGEMPELDPALFQVKAFEIFAWGGVVGAMIRRGLDGRLGSCPKDTRAALSAVEDRVSVWAYDATPVDVTSPAALPERMGQIASAFAVGAAVAWAGVAKTAPKHVRHVRDAVGRMPADEKRLLQDRYLSGQSCDALCAAHGHSSREATFHFADLLEGVRQQCLVA